MRVVDAYCGAGGWSAGAIAAGCMPVLGIDIDSAPLKLWATNCSPAGRAACATIGVDAIEWPEAAADVHVHLSPPCTSLSKARASSASAASVATALDAVRWRVQLVLDGEKENPCSRLQPLQRGGTLAALPHRAQSSVCVCKRDPPPSPSHLQCFISVHVGSPSLRTVRCVVYTFILSLHNVTDARNIIEYITRSSRIYRQ